MLKYGLLLILKCFLVFQDYIADFSELDPDLLITLILENDLPMSSAKQKLVQNEMNYAKRLRSLSSPSELIDRFRFFCCSEIEWQIWSSNYMTIMLYTYTNLESSQFKVFHHSLARKSLKNHTKISQKSHMY